MNTPSEEAFHKSSQILLGFETLRPDLELVPKIRFALETLAFQREENEKVINDFFVIVKNFKNFPITPHLENLAVAQNSKSIFEAGLRILDHLSYEPLFEDVRLITAHFDLSADSESLRKLVIKFFREKAKVDGFQFCEPLVDIFQEKNSFTKIKKILDFYFQIYDDRSLLLLKKAYEHFVSLHSPLQFYAFISESCDLPLLDAIKDVGYSEQEARFEEALSKGQATSKVWALEQIKRLDLNLNSAIVLCGWYGLLPNLLLNAGFESVVNIDIDFECEPLAKRLNLEAYHSDKFQAVTRDIFDLDYQNFDISFHSGNKQVQQFDLLINTSCEHISNFKQWYEMIPEGQLVLLQSNDFFACDEHVNCVNSTAEFRDQTPMQKRLFSGALPLEKYTRYMVIGYK